MPEVTIDPFHTSCKNCVFAEYLGNTQVGCSAGKLDEFKANGTEIIEAYDENREFFVINKDKCLFNRTNNWAARHKVSRTDEMLARIKEEQKLNYALIINLREFSEDPILEGLSKSLSKLKTTPQNIYLIRYQKDETKYPIETIQKALKDSGLRTKWRLQNMLEDDEFINVAHQIVMTQKYPFCMLIEKPNEDFEELVEIAEKRVYNKKPVVIVANDDKKIKLFNVLTYKAQLVVNKLDIFTNDKFYYKEKNNEE